MADIYNVIRGDGVFFEGMTKEQIISAIAEATGNTVEDIDSAFITKIKEINKGNAIKLWLGTNAEYNAIATKEDDVLYFITDDTFVEDMSLAIENLQKKIEENHQSTLNVLENFNQEFETFKTDISNDVSEVEKYFRDKFSETPKVSISPDGSVNCYITGTVGNIPSYSSRTVKVTANDTQYGAGTPNIHATFNKPDDKFNFTMEIKILANGSSVFTKTINSSELPMNDVIIGEMSFVNSSTPVTLEITFTGQF